MTHIERFLLVLTSVCLYIALVVIVSLKRSEDLSDFLLYMLAMFITTFVAVMTVVVSWGVTQ